MAPSEPYLKSKYGRWGTFLKRESKHLAKLYVRLVFQVNVFDFIFCHKNTLYKVDRLINILKVFNIDTFFVEIKFGEQRLFHNKYIIIYNETRPYELTVYLHTLGNGFNS